MTVAEYRRFYLDLLLGILGGNHAHFEITMPAEEQRKVEYDNYRAGLRVLTLVSLIEKNFLSKNDIKALRNFQSVAGVSAKINQQHLSGYIYLRDCIAHNPLAILLTTGVNTRAFVNAAATGQFPFASVSGSSLCIKDTHELHLIVLRFFGENV